MLETRLVVLLFLRDYLACTVFLKPANLLTTSVAAYHIHCMHFSAHGYRVRTEDLLLSKQMHYPLSHWQLAVICSERSRIFSGGSSNSQKGRQATIYYFFSKNCMNLRNTWSLQASSWVQPPKIYY